MINFAEFSPHMLRILWTIFYVCLGNKSKGKAAWLNSNDLSMKRNIFEKAAKVSWYIHSRRLGNSSRGFMREKIQIFQLVDLDLYCLERFSVDFFVGAYLGARVSEQYMPYVTKTLTTGTIIRTPRNVATLETAIPCLPMVLTIVRINL